MFNLNQQWGDLLSAWPQFMIWLTKLKGITCSVKTARTARDKWSCLLLTSYRRPILLKNCYNRVYNWGGKFSTAKKIRQVLQAPVASLWTLFSFSTVKVRVLAPLNLIELLVFFSLCSFHWSLWNFYSVTCVHPLQYTGFNSPSHTFLCIILSVVSHTAPTLMRWGSYYVLSSDNIEQMKIISIFSWLGRHAWNWPNFY